MEQTVIVGLLSLFVGAFVGHRLTLDRDKRKEFNAIADPIRGALIKQISVLSSGSCSKPVVASEDISSLCVLLNACQISGVQRAFAKYQQEGTREKLGHTAEDGSFVLGDTSKYLSAAKCLLKHVPHK